MFYLTDEDGATILEAAASDYLTLVTSARTMQRGHPLSSLTCSNPESGALVVFVPEFPEFVTYAVEEDTYVEILGSFEDQSDSDVWAHLTSNGFYDVQFDPINFLGDYEMLEAVTFSERILLN